MDHNEIMDQLREKLDRNMDCFWRGWLAHPPETLISFAEEISATRAAYNELYAGFDYPNDMLEYLLRFDNPLEVVRDKWIEEQYRPDVSEDMKHALFSIMDSRDAEREYKLDAEYKPPEMGPTLMPGC